MRFNIFQIYLLDYGSILAVGSSKNIIYDPPISANAIYNFLLFPPLNSLVL